MNYNLYSIFSLMVYLLPLCMSTSLKSAKTNRPSSNGLANILRGSWIRRNGQSGAQGPHLGYEPYWYNINESTKSGPVCGEPCTDMMRRYGQICARNRFYNYRTFANACEMVTENCRGTIGWVMTRKGECYPYWRKEEWRLWINKGTLSPELQEEYDKKTTIIHSHETDYMPFPNYDYSYMYRY